MKVKAGVEKTLFVLPNATQQELEHFAKAIKEDKHHIVTNANMKMFIIKKGEMFEIKRRLVKVKK